MSLSDTSQGYGLVTRLMHWLSMIAVVALFAVGWWMVDLSYYDPWYTRAPALHKSFGVALALLIVFRIGWRWRQAGPAPVSTHGTWARFLAFVVKLLLYALLILISLTGYLMTTAEGDDLVVFEVLRVPALVTGIDNLEDTAGLVHEWVAWMLIGLAALHALAALKHLLVDRDRTLHRMIVGE